MTESRTVRAAPLDGGAAWINTDRALSLAELRGQVVLLHFWSAGCVNCLHQAAEIRWLEEEFATRPFVVIGVHDGKFEAEKDVANVASAVRRYGMRHPVLVDPQGAVRDRYAVRAWPTTILVDARGYVAETMSGEVAHEKLSPLVAALLGEESVASARIAIRAPVPRPRTALASPGKILASSDGALFIADSGHHRIVIATQDGRLRAIAGSGLAGARDGAFSVASFQNPQGLARRGSSLYVADAGNHAIRRLDLEKKIVETIATGLRSPWDLALSGERLFIALAGSHQIGVSEHGAATRVFAGAGHEGLVDGALLDAQFSQPSGLALLGETLFVADAESSALRAIANGRVATIAGAGLFEFGDRDGLASEARLQHASGLAADGATLLIADSYNGKLRRFDPATGRIETIAEHLSNPGGVAVAGGKVFVADTDADRVLANGRVLEIVGLKAPPLSGVSETPGPSLRPLPRREIRLAPVALAPGDSALLFDLELAGLEATEGAPFALTVSSTGSVRSAAREEHEFHASLLPLRIPVAIDAATVTGDVRLEVELYVCGKDASRCTKLAAALVQPVTGGGASHEARVVLRVAASDAP